MNSSLMILLHLIRKIKLFSLFRRKCSKISSIASPLKKNLKYIILIFNKFYSKYELFENVWNYELYIGEINICQISLSPGSMWTFNLTDCLHRSRHSKLQGWIDFEVSLTHLYIFPGVLNTNIMFLVQCKRSNWQNSADRFLHESVHTVDHCEFISYWSTPKHKTNKHR